MRHALAHSIVNCDKRALGLHAVLHRTGQHLDISEEGRDELRRKIRQRLIMLLGNQQRMAGEKRAMVQESEREIVLKNDVTRQVSPHNLAEFASLGFVAQGFAAAISEATSAG